MIQFDQSQTLQPVPGLEGLDSTPTPDTDPSTMSTDLPLSSTTSLAPTPAPTVTKTPATTASPFQTEAAQYLVRLGELQSESYAARHAANHYKNGYSATNGRHIPTIDTRTQLFVGNLPFRIRWQDLKDLMRKCGTVLRADVALTPQEQRSKGHGSVLFARYEDAIKAIDVYHGYQWQTRILEVHLDAQDPQGALGMIEANRQVALQQQTQHYQQQALQQQQQLQFQYDQHLQQRQLEQQQYSASSTGSWTIAPPGDASIFPAGSTNSTPILAATTLTSPSEISSSIRSDDTPHSRDSTHPSSTVASPQPTPTLILPPPPPPPGSAVYLPGVNYPLPTFEVAMHSAPSMYPMQNYPLQYMQQNHVNHRLVPPPFLPMPTMSNQHSNRHLFVGNLPFSCQWQDLKDLFRAAGTVLRVDVAQADGRSRGFGSVLFDSAESSARAVQMFDGYELNGRAIKVHFDKFSTSIIGAMNAIPLYGPPPLQSQPSASSIYQYPTPSPPISHLLTTSKGSSPYQSQFTDSPRHYLRPVSTASSSLEVPNSSASLDPALLVTPKMGGNGFEPHLSPTSTSTFSSSTAASGREPPSRIIIPPPFSSSNPFSPLHRLPLMTPSMPAFTLGAYEFAQTPPAYATSFSPGVGNYSPDARTIGPTRGYGHYPINAAPGAPIQHLQGVPPSPAYHPSLASLHSPGGYYPPTAYSPYNYPSTHLQHEYVVSNDGSGGGGGVYGYHDYSSTHPLAYEAPTPTTYDHPFLPSSHGSERSSLGTSGNGAGSTPTRYQEGGEVRRASEEAESYFPIVQQQMEDEVTIVEGGESAKGEVVKEKRSHSIDDVEGGVVPVTSTTGLAAVTSMMRSVSVSGTTSSRSQTPIFTISNALLPSLLRDSTTSVTTSPSSSSSSTASPFSATTSNGTGESRVLQRKTSEKELSRKEMMDLGAIEFRRASLK